MRTFERTHPWLKFKVNLTGAPWRLWTLLGECQSKCEHVAGTPLRPQTAQELYRVYLVKGAVATTAIEGNTLSEDEVILHMEGKLELPESRQYLAQEVENIIEKCTGILEGLRENGSTDLSRDGIEQLNVAVLRDLELDEGVVPGKIRTHQVHVGSYQGVPAEDCGHLLERLCDWLNGEELASDDENRIAFAILKAALAHLYLAWIHPFGDGNGRTARLVEFEILLKSGVPAPSAHLLSNHYNKTRTRYYRELDKASKSGGDVVPFLLYALGGLRDELKLQLNVIRSQQWDVAWRNLVHERFRDMTGAAHVRRRRLVLDLSGMAEPVPRNRLRQVSPRIAEAYARKTEKTLTRDLNVLMKMGLVQRDEAGYRASKEMILAFLPPRLPDSKRSAPEAM